MTAKNKDIWVSVVIVFIIIIIIVSQNFRPFTCIIDYNSLTLFGGLYSLFVSLPISVIYAINHFRNNDSKDIRQTSKIVINSIAFIFMLFFATSMGAELVNKIFAEDRPKNIQVFVSYKHITHSRSGYEYWLTINNSKTNDNLRVSELMYQSVSANRDLMLFVREGFFGYKIVIGFVALSGKEVYL